MEDTFAKADRLAQRKQKQRFFKFIQQNTISVCQLLDVIIIFTTLIGKIPDYTDLKMVLQKQKTVVGMLERDLCAITSKGPQKLQQLRWATLIKFMTKTTKLLEQLYKDVLGCLRLVKHFFASFSNLKHLWINRLDDFVENLALTLAVYKDYNFNYGGGIEDHIESMSSVNMLLEIMLLQYTKIILGKYVLKKELGDGECKLIVRRGICLRVGVSVGEIPLA